MAAILDLIKVISCVQEQIISGPSILHIIQLCILLGHMCINNSPVFSTMHYNAEIIRPLANNMLTAYISKVYFIRVLINFDLIIVVK